LAVVLFVGLVVVVCELVEGADAEPADDDPPLQAVRAIRLAIRTEARHAWPWLLLSRSTHQTFPGAG